MEKLVVRSRTAADMVYHELYQDIINLRFQPGEKLSETMLAERYGVSRDPVRKSISRLVQEGLLISRPQYGTIVSPISIQQGIDICDIRLLLETYAVHIAVKNLDESTIFSLVNEYEDLQKRLNSDDQEKIRQEIYSLDGRMHKVIYDASGNNMIANIINSYSFIIRRIQISNIMWHNRQTATMQEMGKIIKALSSRDEEAAVEAMSVHIENIKKTIVLPIEKEEEKR